MKTLTQPPETQPLLQSHGSIQLINTHPGQVGGTLSRKQVKTMDELRVWQDIVYSNDKYNDNESLHDSDNVNLGLSQQQNKKIELRYLVNDLNRICDELDRSKNVCGVGSDLSLSKCDKFSC